jgi:hypothetical protein
MTHREFAWKKAPKGLPEPILLEDIKFFAFQWIHLLKVVAAIT